MAGPQLPSQARRRRGHREQPSKLRGVRLLWDENIFGVIGAFCVAAFALAVTWSVLEGVLQLNGAFAGVVAMATAVATLEGISRRHYEQRRSSPSLRRVPATRAEPASANRADDLAEHRRAA
jgi:ABC-type transport system involved in cytochrome bd biosynthesis fused ATPase/permease subunit